MVRRKRLTDEGVAALKPRAQRYAHPDPELPGHYVRVTPRGVKSYTVVALDPNRKQVWETIGHVTELDLEEAREKARKKIKAIKSGADRAGPQSFQTITEQWLVRHVDAKGLRSATEIRSKLGRHVLPTWGGRTFISIKRKDVAELLDQIEDSAGPVAADKVLAYLSGLFNWFAARSDNFASPIVKGMRRSKPAERARERTLADDEIRKLWDDVNGGAFGGIVKLLLLTGQRREKVAAMRWQDVGIDGTWTIPAEDREKGNAGELVLPKIALDIIKAQPRMGDNPFVFAGRGDSHFSGYSKAKAEVGGDWRLHDLRRTARSLMARAGVRPDIAERVLGHAIRGVEGIYDRHEYRNEKAAAIAALATLIDSIVNPVDEVVPMRGRKAVINRGT